MLNKVRTMLLLYLPLAILYFGGYIQHHWYDVGMAVVIILYYHFEYDLVPKGVMSGLMGMSVMAFLTLRSRDYANFPKGLFEVVLQGEEPICTVKQCGFNLHGVCFQRADNITPHSRGCRAQVVLNEDYQEAVDGEVQ